MLTFAGQIHFVSPFLCKDDQRSQGHHPQSKRYYTLAYLSSTSSLSQLHGLSAELCTETGFRFILNLGPNCQSQYSPSLSSKVSTSVSDSAMRKYYKSIMTLIPSLDLPNLTSLFSCESASQFPRLSPIRYWTIPPHADTIPTGMNQRNPKSDLCISTASSIICCEHPASISDLQSYKNCCPQPTTPLHKSPSFPKPPSSSLPPRIPPNLLLTPPPPSSWIPSPF